MDILARKGLSCRLIDLHRALGLLEPTEHLVGMYFSEEERVVLGSFKAPSSPDVRPPVILCDQGNLGNFPWRHWTS